MDAEPQLPIFIARVDLADDYHLGIMLGPESMV